MMGDLQEILDSIGPQEKVLDIGGGMQPLTRADYVVDIIPYTNRAEQGHLGELPERFTNKTWFQVDFSTHQPLPFPDKSIDFIFCSHTLEDIADPFWLCKEMNRVGKRGYIEVPSRAQESAMQVGGMWKMHKKYLAGYYHHRWFIENKTGELIFTYKNPFIHHFSWLQIPKRNIKPQHAYLAFWWNDAFLYKENILLSAQEMFDDMRDFKCWYYANYVLWRNTTWMKKRMDKKIKNVQRRSFWIRVRDRIRLLY